MSELTRNLTYKSLNKPLTILGVERRLFFGALIVAAVTFNFFSSLAGGVAMFALLYFVARRVTTADSQILHIVINAARFKAMYDASKRDPYQVQVIRRG